jgi:hypothetical protein
MARSKSRRAERRHASYVPLLCVAFSRKCPAIFGVSRRWLIFYGAGLTSKDPPSCRKQQRTAMVMPCTLSIHNHITAV